MRAFTLSLENTIIFWELCKELKAETEEERTAILDAVAELGAVKSIVSSSKTKEEYKQHLAKQFNAVELQSDGSIKAIILDDQPKGDSNGGTTDESSS